MPPPMPPIRYTYVHHSHRAHRIIHGMLLNANVLHLRGIGTPSYWGGMVTHMGAWLTT